MQAVRIRVRGQVQGVGFRPFVWRLARDHGLDGWVLNDAEGVLIHLQAAGEGAFDPFTAALQRDRPPLSVIDAVEIMAADADPGLTAFEIVESRGGGARTRVTPDAATCPDCLREVFDPADRRHGYAFANCTHCGPRFSIVEDIPYDRAATTMRAFALCPACQAEYDDPADRRFHAQPVACAACGPRVWLETADGRTDDNPISAAAALLRQGAILAVKGLGGFHLACDALNEEVVSTLRRRKRRPAKPFALMGATPEVIARYARIGEGERALLTGPAAPIVLLEAAGQPVAPSVAPGQWALGWMLPAMPLHHLLLDAVGGPLVMTSGNLSGEPQVIGNDEARQKLSPFVDGFLMHDRGIARRLDDPVTRFSHGAPRIQRRARGFAPETLAMPASLTGAPPVLAYGAFLKAALCLTRDGSALLSHHLGDLDDALTAEEFGKAERDYAALLDHRPEMLACDLHPDYPSTARAEERAAAEALPLLRVQHHHAHIAAVMAENGWNPADDGPVLGVAMDGLGWGTDGSVWGGEWLLCDYAGFHRLGHLKPVPLPGGGMAQLEPWRNLLAQLDAAGLAGKADAVLGGKPLATLRAAVAKGVNAPLTSSAGRLFDAMAAAIGIAPDRQSFEGEAAMTLETLARPAMGEVPPGGGYPFDVAGGTADPAPLWPAVFRDIDRGVDKRLMAARFHAGLAALIDAQARRLMAEGGARAVALSGGCFQNITLFEECLRLMADLPVLTHSAVPPNDGGLALGQAAVAAQAAIKPD